MEAQFQKFLASKGLNSTDFVISARVAYRSQVIAGKRLTDEKGDFTGRGFAINDAGDFNFKN